MKNKSLQKQKIKLFGKPQRAVTILSSGNTEKDLEKIEEIKQARSEQKDPEKLLQKGEK